MKLINATELDRKSGERSGEISVWILFPGNVSRQEIRSGRVAKRSAFILQLKRMQFAIFHLPFAIPFKKANWNLPALRNPGCKRKPLFLIRDYYHEGRAIYQIIRASHRPGIFYRWASSISSRVFLANVTSCPRAIQVSNTTLPTS